MGRQIKRFERREKYSLDEENKHFAERENRSGKIRPKHLKILTQVDKIC